MAGLGRVGAKLTCGNEAVGPDVGAAGGNLGSLEEPSDLGEVKNGGEQGEARGASEHGFAKPDLGAREDRVVIEGEVVSQVEGEPSGE